MTHVDPVGEDRSFSGEPEDLLGADHNARASLEVLITGGTSGMGKATALRLAGRGTNLILVGRSQAKGEAAVEEIERVAGATATFLAADMSLMREIPPLAERVRQLFDRVDVLVHAAGGVFPLHRTLTAEGLEHSFATQFLARFALTNELLPLLHAASVAKVISVAGGGAGSRRVDLHDLQGERRYSMFGAIGRAAAANDLLTKQQVVRLAPIHVYNYGPGLVRTATSMPNAFMRFAMNTVGRLFSRSADAGARDIEQLILGDATPGFYGPGLKPRSIKRYRFDPTDGARLWAHSDHLLRRLVGHAAHGV